MRTLYTPDPHHYCPLPEHRPHHTIVECEECGRRWVFDQIPWERNWRPLHWFDFRLKKKAGL